MATVSIDEVDIALLARLQDDGRHSYQALADAVGLSRTAVRTRVHRLLDADIARIVTVMHPEIIGLGADAALLIRASTNAFAAAQALAEDPAVYSVQLTTGEQDVIAWTRARDEIHLMRHVDQIRQLDQVLHVRVFWTVEWARPPHPISPLHRTAALDAIDWDLLEHVQRDGRVSYTALGDLIGLSQAATRARFLRLLSEGVLKVVAVPAPTVLGLRYRAGFAASINGSGSAVAANVADLDGVRAVATGWGAYAMIGDLAATDPHKLMEVLDHIRRVRGVEALTSWMAVDVHEVSPISVRNARPDPSRLDAAANPL